MKTRSKSFVDRNRQSRLAQPFPRFRQPGGNQMRSTFRSALILFAILFAAVLPVMAQGTLEDYQRAQSFLPGNLRHKVFTGEVAPNWIEKTDRFWYRSTGPNGTEFILV